MAYLKNKTKLAAIATKLILKVVFLPELWKSLIKVTMSGVYLLDQTKFSSADVIAFWIASADVPQKAVVLARSVLSLVICSSVVNLPATADNTEATASLLP